MLSNVAKLYIDAGSGFNNNRVISHIIHGDERKVEFDLGNFGAINSLRFDPINDYSVLHINTIVIVREDNSSYELDYYYSNALYQDRHTFLFASKNPQIFLLLFNQKTKRIKYKIPKESEEKTREALKSGLIKAIRPMPTIRAINKAGIMFIPRTKKRLRETIATEAGASQ